MRQSPWHDEGRAPSTRRLRAEALGVRVVCLCTGLVLGSDGGLLARLLTPFKLGLGGPIGSGRQWMSWIERRKPAAGPACSRL
jgi:NAD dependent epimerase/dehydratase family enzyme